MRLLRGVSGEAILTQANVIMTRSGVAFICGGKWSSYRAMAEELIDYVIKHKQLDRGRVGPAGDGAGGDDTAALKPPLTPCVTRDVKLLGGSGCFATGPCRAGAEIQTLGRRPALKSLWRYRHYEWQIERILSHRRRGVIRHSVDSRGQCVLCG